MKRIITWIQKHTYIVFAVCLVGLLAIYARYYQETKVYPVSQDRMVEVSSGKKYEACDKLSVGDAASQKLEMKYASFYGVRIPIHLKGKTISGTIQIVIADDTDKVTLCEEEIDLAQYEAGESEITVTLDQADNSRNEHVLSWTLSPTSLGDETQLNLYNTADPKNGKQAYLYTILLNNTTFVQGYFKLLLALIFAGVLLVIVMIWRKCRTEYLFLATAIIIGFLYSLTVTPYSAPDEAAHFYSTYYISDKLMGDTKSQDGYILMRKEDAATYGLCEELNKNSYNAVYQTLRLPDGDKSLVEFETERVGVLDYFYIPGAIGITIARLLGLNPIVLMYLGRFFNMAAYLILTFFAIRKLPFAKSLLAVVAVSPMVLHQVSSFSYDAMIYGLAFLFTSWCMKGIYEKGTLGWKDLIGILITGCLLAPAKSGAYLPICFLILLIPGVRFAGKKKYIAGVWGILALFVIAAALNFVILSAQTVGGSGANIVTWTGTPTPTYSVSDIVSAPRWFIQIILCTLATNISGYFTTMFGSVMSSYNVYISTIWTVFYIGLTVLAAVKCEGEEQQVKTGHKIWIGLLVLGVVFLIEVGMLIGWTPQGYSTIEGVQGRYFIPALPLMLLLLRNHTLTVKKDLTRVLFLPAFALNAVIIMEMYAQALIK